MSTIAGNAWSSVSPNLLSRSQPATDNLAIRYVPLIQYAYTIFHPKAYRPIRGDVKIPTYKPHTNHKKPSVSSHTLATTTICDLSHSVCRSPLTDMGNISSVTYVCHPLWFVCGHREIILTFPPYSTMCFVA